MVKEQDGQVGFSRWRKRMKNLRDAEDEMSETFGIPAAKSNRNENGDASNTACVQDGLDQHTELCNISKLPETSKRSKVIA